MMGAVMEFLFFESRMFISGRGFEKKRFYELRDVWDL